MLKRLALLLIALELGAQGQKTAITLETLPGAAAVPAGRAPNPLLWAPDGKTFLVRQAGTLQIYNPAARSSRSLVSISALDSAAVPTAPVIPPFNWQNRRVQPGGVEFSASGKELLYAAGGDLFLIDVASGKWRQITKTPERETDSRLSPDGKNVVFRRGWDLFVADVETGRETRLTSGGTETLRNGALDWVYPEELDLGRAVWWSPDSKSIAYLQFDTSREPLYPQADLLRPHAVYEPQRYPQAGENNADVRLGVVAVSGGPTRWMDTGDTRHAYLIARAGWMPDSKGVYAVRLNRVQNQLELLRFDAASGDGSVVFREKDPYWINLEGDVRFLKDGKRFLWMSERDGFRHIYLYSNDGKSVKQLTSGNWEVTAINGVNDGEGRVFYTSSETSHMERQLYSIKLDGSDKRRLTRAAGTHAVSMGFAVAYYLDTYSNLQTPPRVTIHAANGDELGVYREADRSTVERYNILPTEIVEFKNAEGTQLYGRLIKPLNYEQGKKYPVIVNVYGGPGVALPAKNEWPQIGMDQVYAQHGYAVWEAENRGAQGRGHAFETPIYHKLGVIELADQVAGVKHLIVLGIADPERIAIRGWSYGGFMTANALLNAPDVFRCGIAGAPVTDWRNYDTIYTERYMGLPSENPEYEATALPPKAANLKGRLMIAHNLQDDNVLFQNTMQLVDALQQAKKIFDLALYPQKTHGVTGPAERQLNATMLEFFDRWLK